MTILSIIVLNPGGRPQKGVMTREAHGDESAIE